MNRSQEARAKIAHARVSLLTPEIEGILVGELPNFSYYTAGGRGFLGLAAAKACAYLLIARDRAYLIANNIEALRLAEEELPRDVFQTVSVPWPEDGSLQTKARELAGGPVIADGERADWFLRARSTLLPEEAARFRALSLDAAQALEGVLAGLRPGCTELAVAGGLSGALWVRGCEPISLFVAADERSERVRHFIPTEKTAARKVIASICARRGGLVASVTRTRYFASPTDSERRAYGALLRVEAATLNALGPGVMAGAVFSSIADAYAKEGMPGEWQNHHQGGLTGYLPREIRFDMNSGHILAPNQAYAFNPSCPGSKLEDTVLLTQQGVEVLSACAQWPTIGIEGRARPDLLVLE